MKWYYFIKCIYVIIIIVILESGLDYVIKAAVDINTVTNRIYSYNFPHITNLNRSIEVSTY